MYSVIGGESIQMAMELCHHFCRCVAQLKNQNGMDEWIETLGREVLISLYFVHRHTVLGSCSERLPLCLDFVAAAQWKEILKTSYLFLTSENEISSSALVTTEQICDKVQSLCVYMQISLDQFLIHVSVANEGHETRIARDRLCRVLDQILNLVGRLSNISDYFGYIHLSPIDSLLGNEFLHSAAADIRPGGLCTITKCRDTILFLLYTFADLLKNMLEPTVDLMMSSQVHCSAIAICKLSGDLDIQTRWGTDALVIKRTLFWAGLILTEFQFPLGQIVFCGLLTQVEHSWIKSRIHESISSGHHYSDTPIFLDEEGVIAEFFRNMERCISVSDIWRLRTTNFSLAHYAKTQAAWWLGLHLVRLEQKPHIGRTLTIIGAGSGV